MKSTFKLSESISRPELSQYLACGRSNQEIGQILYICEGSVKPSRKVDPQQVRCDRTGGSNGDHYYTRASMGELGKSWYLLRRPRICQGKPRILIAAKLTCD